MKVAVVSIGSFDTQYSDYHIMRDIIVRLLERGHKVNLIQKQYMDTPQYPDAFKKYLGSQLQVQNIRFEKKAKNNLKARYLADLLYYRQACHLLKKSKPDKIFLQSNNTAFFTVFYAKHVLKCPILYNEQDIFPENAFLLILSEKSIIYRVAHLLQKYAYDNATALSTISDDMKSTIVNRYSISEEKIQVIYNWGHEELKAHSEWENTFLQRYPKLSNEYRVIYAGNIGKMQNVELVLETAELLRDKPDIRFFIVGDGVNAEHLKLVAKEKQLTNVIFVGMQPPEEVADLYSAADINVIPLQERLIYAALPSKTADCLLAGKPIIICVDNEAMFSHLARRYGIENAGATNPEQLKKHILKYIQNGSQCNSADFLRDYFAASKNVSEHCTVVEKMN